jgi:hypothetical protein
VLAVGRRPHAHESEDGQALASLLALGLLAAVYLIYVCIGGVLLWPAAAVRLILAILLARACVSRRGIMDVRHSSVPQDLERNSQ